MMRYGDATMRKSKKLLSGQFTMSEALTNAIETMGDAYKEDAWQYEWPEEDRKALNVPRWKAPGWKKRPLK
jgi:hypothetical protein